MVRAAQRDGDDDGEEEYCKWYNFSRFCSVFSFDYGKNLIVGLETATAAEFRSDSVLRL